MWRESPGHLPTSLLADNVEQVQTLRTAKHNAWTSKAAHCPSSSFGSNTEIIIIDS